MRARLTNTTPQSVADEQNPDGIDVDNDAVAVSLMDSAQHKLGHPVADDTGTTSVIRKRLRRPGTYHVRIDGGQQARLRFGTRARFDKMPHGPQNRDWFQPEQLIEVMAVLERDARF